MTQFSTRIPDLKADLITGAEISCGYLRVKSKIERLIRVINEIAQISTNRFQLRIRISQRVFYSLIH